MSLVSVYDALKAASVGVAKAYILASALALSLAVSTSAAGKSAPECDRPNRPKGCLLRELKDSAIDATFDALDSLFRRKRKKISPAQIDVLIDAPKKGTPFIVFDSLGDSIAEGKTPEKLVLYKNYVVTAATRGGCEGRGCPGVHSSEYTIVYTMPDGKKHGQAVYVDKKNRVMLNIRQ